MARPHKCKKVCSLPENSRFGPVGKPCGPEETVTMAVEEYETIRLIDYQGFTQEQCSQYMGIARTTVQQLYERARKKTAQVLIEGKTVHICGGNYRVCDGKETYCRCGGCRKHRCANENNQESIGGKADE